MRWFWLILIGLTLVVLLGAWAGFFQDFEATDWTTFGAAISAFLLGVFNFTRSTTPQPHWELVKFREVRDSARAVRFVLDVVQRGPGNAEQVGFQLKLADAEWGEEVYPSGPKYAVVRRNEVVRLHLLSVEVASGYAELPTSVRARVLYRCLPRTQTARRTRTFKWTR